MKQLFLHPRLYRIFIAPLGSDPDSRRREFILNVLLCGLCGLSFIASTTALADYFIFGLLDRLESLVVPLLFNLLAIGLLVVSRRGHAKMATFGFVGFLLFAATLLGWLWSYRLAQVTLLFALTIVVVGVLLTARLALVTAFTASAILLGLVYIQVTGLQVPYSGWEDQPYLMADAIGYIAIFIIIGIVSWLANRETNRSLQRARSSEAALLRERDNLEIKVLERTRELEDLQASRLLELQPFAEIGWISASLVHEIANPLTAMSLNLEALSKQQHSELVRQTQRSMHQLDKYLKAARKQIKRESELKTFSVGGEVRQIVHLLTHRARRAGVRLQVQNISGVRLYGDMVKFDQLIANLLANAIDASQDGSQVQLTITADTRQITIAVADHGTGIPKRNLEHLFEPFYSTKITPRAGLGIGLVLVKQYIEEDFGGSIAVTSSVKNGTVFTATIPRRSKK